MQDVEALKSLKKFRPVRSACYTREEKFRRGYRPFNHDVWHCLTELCGIVVHVTNGPEFESMDSLKRRMSFWPLYHFLVYSDGSVVKVAPMSLVLYHTKGHNKRYLSIGLVGPYINSIPPIPMLVGLDMLISKIRSLYPHLPPPKAHSDYEDDVECPGEYIREWMNRRYYS